MNLIIYKIKQSLSITKIQMKIKQTSYYLSIKIIHLLMPSIYNKMKFQEIILRYHKKVDLCIQK